MRIPTCAFFTLLFLIAITACASATFTPNQNTTAPAPIVASTAILPTVTPIPTRTLIPTPSPTPRCGNATLFNLASARSGRIDTKFRSVTLGRDMPILIYLPPGYYDSQICYPVLYMLHGYGGPYTEWEKWGIIKSAEELMRAGKIAPFIIVLPEGERSWWFNHYPVVTKNNDGKPWGDYVWKDIVGYTDANYRTLTKRESRAVGGLSAGGQGALMLGITHPEIFGIVGGHSISLREADGSLEFFGTQEYYNQYDPIWLVKNKTEIAKQLTIWLDVGQDDDVWGEEIQRFRKLLDSLQIPFTWHTWPGRHEGTYWTPHIPDYLTWYGTVLAR